MLQLHKSFILNTFQSKAFGLSIHALKYNIWNNNLILKGLFRHPKYSRVQTEEQEQHREVEVKSFPKFSLDHMILTLVQMMQVSLSYSIMMVFMTLNIWLCLAVVLGHTVGYLLFGHN